MQQLDLTLNSTEFSVRRSPRARRLRVSVTPVGKIEIVLPVGVSSTEAGRFIKAHSPWIEEKRRQIANIRPSELNNALPGEIVMKAINEKWRVKNNLGQPELVENANGVTNQCELILNCENDTQAGELLRNWLTQKAKRVLVPWLTAVSVKTGLRYSKASIRGQKTRWASCSARKNINLNRCMMFLTPEQVHYLLVHELCHTREMNHSRRFWNLVANYVPDYQQREKEVNDACYQLPRWAFGD